jgi:hypothetical protein
LDHDHELLFEQVVRPNRTDYRGPIAEFLAKKDAEQAHHTAIGYRTALLCFHTFLGEDATVGDVNEAVGFRYLAHLREQVLSGNSIATYVKCLKTLSSV